MPLYCTEGTVTKHPLKDRGVVVPVSPWVTIMGINYTLATVQTTATIFFSLLLMLPLSSYVDP